MRLGRTEADARRSHGQMGRRGQEAPAGHSHAPWVLFREMPERSSENSTEGIFIIQHERVKACNRFLSVVGDYERDEIEGTCFASFFDPDSISTIEAVCRQNVPLQRKTSVFKAVLYCKNGDRLNVRLRGFCCRFDGKPAVLITMGLLDNPASSRERDGDGERFFNSEDRLVSQTAGG